MRNLILSSILLSCLACGAPAAQQQAQARTWLFAQAPATLAATGLYADVANRTLAADVQSFTPRFPLWSDGDEKRRFIALPAGTAVDTTDMDHWVFPVGTRLWKEFSVNGTLVETRFANKFGEGAADWTYVSYVWTDDGTTANAMEEGGVVTVNGQEHEIPSAQLCLFCHANTRERVLGFSAVQLNHNAAGINLQGMLRGGELPSNTLQGDERAVAALGYLHGNCAHCHNGDGLEFQREFSLRLMSNNTTVESTNAYRTAVGQLLSDYQAEGMTMRIAPGAPEQSAIFHRMNGRGDENQMPPVGTAKVDTNGLAKVQAWIANM